MKLNKRQLLLVLLIILGIFYAFKIVSVNRISSLLVSKPVKLSFTLVSPGKNQCPKCFKASEIINSISKIKNIEISNKKTISPSNLIFRNIVKRYNIKNLPAIIVSGDILDKQVVGIWKSLRGKETDGNIIIQGLLPFYNIAQKKTKGIVDAILLKDGSCKKCFNESRYLGAIKQSGMIIGSSVIYDIASPKGKALVKKYRIEKVPILILSPDAGDYPRFVPSWEKIGTKEKDGWFVFREVQKMGEYKDLKNIKL